MAWSTKTYGVIRGLAAVVGDRVHYLNRFGQGMNGELLAIYVEKPGMILVQRSDWPTPELVDLSDTAEYPRCWFKGPVNPRLLPVASAG